MSSAVSCEFETVLEPYESARRGGEAIEVSHRSRAFGTARRVQYESAAAPAGKVCTLCDSQPTWTGESRKMTLADSVHECGL